MIIIVVVVVGGGVIIILRKSREAVLTSDRTSFTRLRYNIIIIIIILMLMTLQYRSRLIRAMFQALASGTT